VNRALGALQGVVGSGQQALGRPLHRSGALPDNGDDTLHPAAERCDIGVDRDAALLAPAQRIALLLGDELLGDVGVRLHLAAAVQRPADRGYDAAILHLEGLGVRSSRGRPANAFALMAGGIAREGAGGCAERQ